MIYHISTWGGGGNLETVGIYGVELFFVISGLSLATAYASRLEWRTFLVRRAARILPLLFLVTLLVPIAMIAARGAQPYSVLHIASNFAVAPIIANPALAIPVGAWSIGVELGFYLMFPLLMSLRTRWLIPIGCVGFIWPVLMRADQALGSQWVTYVAIPNHLSFFVGGILLSRAPRLSGRNSAILAAAAFAVFIAMSRPGDPIQIVTRAPRAIFIFLCIALVYAVAGLTIQWAPLRILGDISFSLYLLHPLVYEAIPGKGIAHDGLTVTLALVAAYCCWKWYERPAQAMVNRVMRAAKPVKSLETT